MKEASLYGNGIRWFRKVTLGALAGSVRQGADWLILKGTLAALRSPR